SHSARRPVSTGGRAVTPAKAGRGPLGITVFLTRAELRPVRSGAPSEAPYAVRHGRRKAGRRTAPAGSLWTAGRSTPGRYHPRLLPWTNPRSPRADTNLTIRHTPHNGRTRFVRRSHGRLRASALKLSILMPAYNEAATLAHA